MLFHSGEQFNQVCLCASVCALVFVLCLSPRAFRLFVTRSTSAHRISWNRARHVDVTCSVCSCHTSAPLSPSRRSPPAAWHGIQPAAKEADSSWRSRGPTFAACLPACRLLLGQCLCPSLEGAGSLKNNEVQYELQDRRTEEWSRARGRAHWLFITLTLELWPHWAPCSFNAHRY